MIDCCVNPECKSKSKPLSDGELYSLEARSAGIEFFWLCGECADTVSPSFDPTGQLAIIRNNTRRQRIPPHPEHDLRLVAQFGGSTRWHLHQDSQAFYNLK